jgi:hypothetical protein
MLAGPSGETRPTGVTGGVIGEKSVARRGIQMARKVRSSPGEEAPTTKEAGPGAVLSNQVSVIGQAELMGQPTPNSPDVKKPLQLPSFYATSANIAASGNDFTIIFNRNIPLENADGTLNPGLALVMPTVMISLTPQSLKDISLIIPGILEAHEREFGEIVTPFIKRLEADKAKKPK